MLKKLLPEFYCSECRGKAIATNHFYSDGAHRLELTVFHCHKCGLVYIDKNLIKEIIKNWNTGRNTDESIKSLYSKYLERIDDFVEANFIKRGYKRFRFLKKVI